jgi:hypothetical protein
MQLRNARVCLDCDEVHDLEHCPSCASEAFAFLTRWVPAEERRRNPRPPKSQRDVAAAADESSRLMSRMMKGGAVGLAMLAAARWLRKVERSPRRIRSRLEEGGQ